MRIIPGLMIGFSLAVAAPAAPALAQAQAAIAPGMQVTDPAGGLVGTVKAVQGDNLLVKTTRNEALLPKASFRVDGGKLLFGMTQAQLDAEIEKGLAAAQASVVPGATVKAVGGAEIGKIDTISETTIVIALTAGQKIQLNKDALRGNPDGTVTVGLTSDQLQAQIQGSGAATAGGE
jgi:preprotein translocase subunit YajC